MDFVKRFYLIEKKYIKVSIVRSRAKYGFRY
jgi:hypothetical protein